MPSPPLTPRPIVLVADNDLVLRSVLRSLLTRLGVDVTLATDGAEALDRARRGAPAALVLLDLDMPGGGLAVCRALRADPTYAATPIAILTGYTDEAVRRDSLDTGATLFLTKPFNPAELLGQLAPHLGLTDAARTELARVVEQDRGLRLQDVVVARSRFDMRVGVDA